MTSRLLVQTVVRDVLSLLSVRVKKERWWVGNDQVGNFSAENLMHFCSNGWLLHYWLFTTSLSLPKTVKLTRYNMYFCDNLFNFSWQEEFQWEFEISSDTIYRKEADIRNQNSRFSDSVYSEGRCICHFIIYTQQINFLHD